MQKVLTKRGNAIICQDQDLLIAQNLIKLLDLFEEDQNNDFNFYNKSEERFEIELRFKNFCGKTLSQVLSGPDKRIMPAQIAQEFAQFEIDYLAAYKYFNANSKFWSDEKYKLEEEKLNNLDLKLAAYKSNFSRAQIIELDLSAKKLLTNLEDFCEKLDKNQVSRELEIILHEICHIYTAKIYKAHGKEFKANCQYFAQKVSEKYFPVNAARFSGAKYKRN